MRAYASSRSLSLLCLLILAGIFAVSVRPVHAQIPRIEIKDVLINRQDGHYQLSANIVYNLSSKARNALQKGIPLYWDVSVKVAQSRNWIWDKTIFSYSTRLRIQYQALFNSYRVTRIENNESESYSNLQAALTDMGLIKDLMLVKQSEMDPDQNYYAGIKVNFDREALPLPLRPESYVNSQWYLSSDWMLWPVEK
ncbi:MAG: DUF4390 domain-containing protein [Methylomicrobium sp.]|nr:DUF4390 domain-containing protein [Methylomicrobium sp.]